jgi:hypothetical protein
MSSVVYLNFAGTTASYVDFGSDLSLDNMGITRYQTITYDGWARLDSLGCESFPGSGIFSRIFGKSNHNIFEFVEPGLLQAYWNGSSPKISRVSFTPDSEWHHFACTYDNTPASPPRYFRIWIDGVEPSYLVQLNGTSLLSDSANNLDVSQIDGDVAWLRITQSVLWTADFTPPNRCSIPTPDADTVGLWVTEGSGTTTYNLGFATADGNIINGTWGSDSCGGIPPRWQIV